MLATKSQASMVINKTFTPKQLITWTGHHIPWILIWSSLAPTYYHFYKGDWFHIPWLPVSIIGTAVAFYLGFKNNSAYDRMWEARKIWGAIVNSSRAWATYVVTYVTDDRLDNKDASKLHEIRQRLIYRHIAWLYALRGQLLKTSPWEHTNLPGLVGNYARRIRQDFGVGLVEDDVTKFELKLLLPDEEHDRMLGYKNTATQIINQQGVDLRELEKEGYIDNFRHVELNKVLYDFYEHQGKCERIKKFPLPRQYASISRYFVTFFILLLPFSMVSTFTEIGSHGHWLSIPFTAIVCFVYVVMEIVGDYSENPFSGMAYDIPMLSLCRTIEIDLREVLGETDLPPAIEAKKNILM